MGHLINHPALVLRWSPQRTEHGLLRRFGREEEIEPPVQHQHGDLHAWGEVDRVGFRKRGLQVEAAHVQQRERQPGLDREKTGAPSPRPSCRPYSRSCSYRCPAASGGNRSPRGPCRPAPVLLARGWSRTLAARASRSRRAAGSSPAPVPPERNFKAARRCNFVASASQTVPIPPAPR